MHEEQALQFRKQIRSNLKPGMTLCHANYQTSSSTKIASEKFRRRVLVERKRVSHKKGRVGEKLGVINATVKAADGMEKPENDARILRT